MTRSFEWTYKHLICEFDHWDICLSGLVEYDNKKWLCKPINSTKKRPDYRLYLIEWDEECQEFLDDYKVVYRHWVYENRKRKNAYNGDSSWFLEKWKNYNPIEKKEK